MGMKWFTVCALLLVMAFPAIADKIVRDRSGNIIETRENRGTSTIVRDQYGNIIGFRDYDSSANDVVVRDPNGNPDRYEDGDNE